MNANWNPYDLTEIMKLVKAHPGILRDRVIESFRDRVDHKTRSKMQRAQRKLKGRLFIQKRGGKCYFYTAEYAKEHNIPERIQVKKREYKYAVTSGISTADIEGVNFIQRMKEIDQHMRVIG